MLQDSLMKRTLRLPTMRSILIIIFPFVTYFGQFIEISIISLSNIFSTILLFVVIDSILKMKYRNIKWHIAYFVLLIFYGMISLVWSDYSDYGVLLIAPLATGFVAAAFIATFNKEELMTFFKSLSVFTVCVLILAIYETFTGNNLIYSNENFLYKLNDFGMYFPYVCFANPNDLAQFLVVGLPITAIVIFEKRNSLIIPAIIYASSLFVIISTESTLGIICVFITTVVYLVFGFLTSKNERFVKISLLLTALVILLITVISFVGVDWILDQMHATSYSERGYIYSSLINLGFEHLFFGAGLGGSYTVSVLGPHNMFLFIFADFGIWFTLGFILVLFSLFFNLCKNIKNLFYGLNLNVIMLSIFVTFPLFSSMSSANEQRKAIWILLGLVLAVVNNNKEMEEQRKDID